MFLLRPGERGYYGKTLVPSGLIRQKWINSRDYLNSFLYELGAVVNNSKYLWSSPRKSSTSELILRRTSAFLGCVQRREQIGFKKSRVWKTQLSRCSPFAAQELQVTGAVHVPLHGSVAARRLLGEPHQLMWLGRCKVTGLTAGEFASYKLLVSLQDVLWLKNIYKVKPSESCGQVCRASCSPNFPSLDFCRLFLCIYFYLFEPHSKLLNYPMLSY